jgi:two-component system, OmpR family, response regulator
MNALRVLVVDDDATTRQILSRLLIRDGHDVETAACGDEALAIFAPGRYDLVIADLVMPGFVDGLGVLDGVRRADPSVEVLLITANATVETAIQAMKRGAADYLQKPVVYDELALRLQRLQNQRELETTAGDLRVAMDQTERCAAERVQELEFVIDDLRQRLDTVAAVISGADGGARDTEERLRVAGALLGVLV